MGEKTADYGPWETITVNSSASSSAALREAAATTGDTLTDTIHKAVQLWSAVIALQRTHGAIYFREPNGATADRVHIS